MTAAKGIGPRPGGAGLRGFTLLEMLVALAVFGVVGVMAARILAGMVEVGDFTRERGAALADIQRAFGIIARDVEQLTFRSVRDDLGDSLPACTVGTGATLAEFTRAGWQNPLGYARSELQRVAYTHEGEELVRTFWPVLDRSPATRPVRQILLTGVSQAQFVALDAGGEEHGFWPSTSEQGEQGGAPAALELRLRFERRGAVERLWVTPAGFPAIPEADPDAPPNAPPEQAPEAPSS